MNVEQSAGAASLRHTLFEDIYAVLTGCTLAVFGLLMLKAAGLVTGGMAGLALLLSYLVPMSVGVLFALLNIPFLGLGGRSMGKGFVAKAVGANLLIMFLAIAAPLGFRIGEVNSLFAALVGGTLIGVGLLLLARHQVGIGGLGILALVLQKAFGWNAGRTMMIGDALILCAAAPVLNMGMQQFAYSVMSAIATAGVLIVFHKPGRYTGH